MEPRFCGCGLGAEPHRHPVFGLTGKTLCTRCGRSVALRDRASWCTHVREIVRTDYDPARRFENVPPEFRYSTAWTDRERLMAVVVLANLMADDASAGWYSAIGRPNSTSIGHLAALPAEEIESARESIERFTWEHFNPPAHRVVRLPTS